MIEASKVVLRAVFRFRFTEKNSHWYAALAVSIVMSVIGVIVPCVFRESYKDAQHFWYRFGNEWLAKHQLLYGAYFGTLGLNAEFHHKGFKGFALGASFCTGILFFFISVLVTTHQENLLKEAHACAGASCFLWNLPPMTLMCLSGVPLAFAIFSLFTAFRITSEVVG